MYVKNFYEYIFYLHAIFQYMEFKIQFIPIILTFFCDIYIKGIYLCKSLTLFNSYNSVMSFIFYFTHVIIYKYLLHNSNILCL